MRILTEYQPVETKVSAIATDLATLKTRLTTTETALTETEQRLEQALAGQRLAIDEEIAALIKTIEDNSNDYIEKDTQPDTSILGWKWWNWVTLIPGQNKKRARLYNRVGEVDLVQIYDTLLDLNYTDATALPLPDGTRRVSWFAGYTMQYAKELNTGINNYDPRFNQTYPGRIAVLSFPANQLQSASWKTFDTSGVELQNAGSSPDLNAGLTELAMIFPPNASAVKAVVNIQFVGKTALVFEIPFI